MQMDEIILWGRNTIVSALADAIGVKITLSEEQDPMAEPPYGYYSVITPYAPGGEFGTHIRLVAVDPQTSQKYLDDIRAEYPEMLLSFTFCGTNRQLPDRSEVNGEAEALALAMKGVAWFLQVGKSELSAKHLVVLRVSNAASRSGTVGDVYVRRWGFDVAIRYKAMTVQRLDIVEHVNTYKKEE